MKSMTFLAVLTVLSFAAAPAAAWVDCFPACTPPYVCDTDVGECYFAGASLVINEVDYDQPSTDATEFIEIYNRSPIAHNLDNVTVVLMNGSTNPAASYATFDLPNVTLHPGDYFVICANAALTPNCDLDVSPDTNLIQNGAPDAIVLFIDGVLSDMVSYEGDANPYFETSGVGLVDTGADLLLGLSRHPDGNDTDVNNLDFYVRCITPGAANSAFGSLCTCGNGNLDAGEMCDDWGRANGDGCDENCQVEVSCDPACVNGTCTAPDTCTCDTGWEGAVCDVPVCATACVNGTCTAPDTCTCDTGWEGAICDVPICPTACVNGTCTAPDTCTCGIGWEGAICDVPICATPCDNGTCTAPDTCTCDLFWAGPTCADPFCDPPCEGGDLCIGGQNQCLKTGALVINEIDYDMPGAGDALEFVELYNASPDPVSLAGMEIVLINGSGGGAVEYNRFALPDVALASGDFFVLCGNAALVPNCDLDVAPDTDLIQNGAPDAVALVLGAAILDTVSYEGDTGAPYTEGQGVLQVDPNVAGLSLSRKLDGVDTNVNLDDFAIRCVTAGLPNSPWEGACTCGDGVVDAGETCDDGDRVAGDGCSDYCAVETGWSCPPGGGDCAPICDPACVNGTCTAPATCTCDAGWDGPACDACADGYWGAACQACPDCNNGTCDDGLAGDGSCICDAGFAEPDCLTCLDGYWGAGCLACPACVHGTCDDGAAGTGACLCDAGWAGALCDECADGRWGAACEACPACVNGTCDDGVAGTGACQCDPGWIGALCDDKTCFPACDAPLICEEDVGACYLPGALVINEIDYDQPATDNDEFVEIYNVSSTPIPLAGVAVVLVNGANSLATPYATFALPPVLLPPNGYFVVCGNAANVPNCDLDVSPDSNLIQNGAPDAVGLTLGQTLLDAVSYEGDTMAGSELSRYTETAGVPVLNSDSGAVRDIGIARYPDGADTGDNAADFHFRCATPGAANDLRTAGCNCGNGAIEDPEETCDYGDAEPGDGCSDLCVVEQGWACYAEGCETVCGDSFVVAGIEECDFGDKDPGDGCSDACLVEDGWTCDGTGCAPICDPACVNGTCTAPDTCTCDTGWEGALCDAAICATACVNGACTAPDTCTCDTGWEGDLCDAAICATACVNGDCTAPDTCTCDTGWEGDACETAICATACVNGACTAPDTCTCDAGWQGGLCDAPACDPACVNGTCTAPVTCTCATGWEGAACDAAICETACVTGDCTAPDTCTCDTGWEGAACDVPICATACVNGDCTAPDFCTCDDGWTGFACDTPVCDPWCIHGTCVAPDACDCETGWEGATCNDAICATACVNGACTAPDTCTCDDGWDGATCDVPVCDPACGQDARCVGPDDCECDEGFEGDGYTCTPVNPCADQPDWTACDDGACFDEACETLGANDACEDAIPLTAGQPEDGTLEGFHAWWQAAADCLDLPGGIVDAYFTFEAEAGVRYAVTATPDGSADLAVLLRGGCDAAATACLAGANDEDAGAAETAYVTPDAAGTVVVQVILVGGDAAEGFEVRVDEAAAPGDQGGGDAGGDTAMADEATPDVIEPEDAGQDPGTERDPGTVQDVPADTTPADGWIGDEGKPKATGGGCTAAGAAGGAASGTLWLVGLLGVAAAAFRRRRS